MQEDEMYLKYADRRMLRDIFKLNIESNKIFESLFICTNNINFIHMSKRFVISKLNSSYLKSKLTVISLNLTTSVDVNE